MKYVNERVTLKVNGDPDPTMLQPEVQQLLRQLYDFISKHHREVELDRGTF